MAESMSAFRTGSTRVRLFNVLGKSPNGVTHSEIKAKAGLLANSGYLGVLLQEEVVVRRIKTATDEGEGGRTVRRYVLTAQGRADLEKGPIAIDIRHGPPRVGVRWTTARVEAGTTPSKGKKAERQLTAIIEREGRKYVSLCPELDIRSQGKTIEEARSNLQEAIELFLQSASAKEIQSRLHEEVYVTRLGVAIG